VAGIYIIRRFRTHLYSLMGEPGGYRSDHGTSGALGVTAGHLYSCYGPGLIWYSCVVVVVVRGAATASTTPLEWRFFLLTAEYTECGEQRDSY
jgi:hypothetical protein